MVILVARDVIKTFLRRMWPFKNKEAAGAVALTRLVEDRIDTTFERPLRESVRDILREQCGIGLPLMHTVNPKDYDRIRLAVIKLSGGTIEGIERGVREAHVDWRDVLLGAGFGADETAHLNWNP